MASFRSVKDGPEVRGRIRHYSERYQQATINVLGVSANHLLSDRVKVGLVEHADLCWRIRGIGHTSTVAHAALSRDQKCVHEAGHPGVTFSSRKSTRVSEWPSPLTVLLFLVPTGDLGINDLILS